MKTLMLLQPGDGILRNRIWKLKPHELRIASAYVSSETVRLLRHFRGVKKTLLFDYDPSRLTAALLSSLVASPKSTIFVAERIELFHPKVFIVDEDRAVHLLIGSSNATRGGLVSNIELVAHHTLDRRYDGVAISAVDHLWSDMLRVASSALTKKFISLRSSELAIVIPRAKRGRRARRVRMPVSLAGRALGPSIFLDKFIGKETGAGGTQIQFPINAIRDYFGNDGHHNVRIEIVFRGRMYATQITHHPNKTHRITLSFLEKVDRPALLRFKRLSTKIYAVKVFNETSAAYGKAHPTARMTRLGAHGYRYY